MDMNPDPLIKGGMSVGEYAPKIKRFSTCSEFPVGVVVFGEVSQDLLYSPGVLLEVTIILCE